MAESSRPVNPLLFAALAVERGLLHPEVLSRAASACADDPGLGLPERLVADGVLTPEQRAELCRDIAAMHPPPAADDESRVPPEHPGRYEVVGKVGRGGQAVVLLALDRFIGREVALKILSPEHAEEEVSAADAPRSVPHTVRFLREARITGQLEHPNIVPVHEVGRRADGSLYYSMRLVRGRTLNQELRRCDLLAERLALLKPFLDLCHAIAFAHSRGVIHRDIKPANVMVGEFGETFVLDWGVARVAGSADTTRNALERRLEQAQEDGEERTSDGLIGTPSYMSPEQARGEVDLIDHRSDIWALGVVLYQILTGRRPFKGKTEVETLLKITTEPLPPVRSVCREAPPELAAIAERALRPKREDRYQSAMDLARDVGAFMTGGRVSAYEYSTRELLGRFVRRHKVAVGAAAALLAVILAALVAVTMALGRERLARADAQAAREREHDERLLAGFHLAQAWQEKAERATAEGDHARAAMLAAASLRDNPAHPGSPPFEPGFAARHPESLELRVRAASRLHDASFAPRLRLERTALVEDTPWRVAFSRDGRLLAAALNDGRPRLWSAEGGPLRALEPLQSILNDIAFSPDGARLAVATDDGRLVLQDTAGGAVLRQERLFDGPTLSVAWSPDGRLLAAGGVEGAVRLVDAAGEGPARSLQAGTGKVQHIAFSPDGTLLALAAEGVEIRAVADGAPRARLGPAVPMFTAAFSDDGTRIAAGGQDRTVYLWETAGWKQEAVLEGHTNAVMDVAFSPDGARLASGGSDQTLRVWDMRTHRPLASVAAHDGFVRGVAFAPDGRRLCSVGYDKAVRLWALEPGRPRTTLVGHTDTVYALAFSPDGRRVATGGWDHAVRLWDADGTAGPVLRGHTGAIYGLAWSPDGRVLVSAGRDLTVRLWDARTGEPGLVLRSGGADFHSVSYSRDGKRIAAGATDGRVHLWDVETGRERQLVGHKAELWQTAFSPDGKLLASASGDRMVRLWDAATGQLVRELAGHTDWVSGLAFSPDSGRLATSAKDGLVLVWDVRTGERRATHAGHAQWANAVSYSPDGRLLASGSDDATVRVRDAATGELLQILSSDAEVAALEFSPDGRTLARADGSDVVLEPVDFSALEAEPTALLEEAGRAAGLVLDGFELRRAPGGRVAEAR